MINVVGNQERRSPSKSFRLQPWERDILDRLTPVPNIIGIQGGIRTVANAYFDLVLYAWTLSGGTR